ncbi:MAG: hypothetical protein AAB358_02495 [Patescibacteria group bacterium]
MRASARAKVGNKRGNPGYRSSSAMRGKTIIKSQQIKSRFEAEKKSQPRIGKS